MHTENIKSMALLNRTYVNQYVSLGIVYLTYLYGYRLT
jgi:hypothetical protein